MSVQCVFWDFGGVVTTSPFERFGELEQRLGLPVDFIRQTNAKNSDTNAWALLERSEVDAETFSKLFLKETEAAGHPVSGELVLQALRGEVRPLVAGVIQQLRGVRIQACLTNNISTEDDQDMTHVRGDRSAEEGVLALFDQVVESSVEGVRKPDPAFYERALQRVGVQPDQVVFLDDLGINLKPARAMGMQTIKVVDPMVAMQTLQDILGIPLHLTS